MRAADAVDYRRGIGSFGGSGRWIVGRRCRTIARLGCRDCRRLSYRSGVGRSHRLAQWFARGPSGVESADCDDGHDERYRRVGPGADRGADQTADGARFQLARRRAVAWITGAAGVDAIGLYCTRLATGANPLWPLCLRGRQQPGGQPTGRRARRADPDDPLHALGPQRRRQRSGPGGDALCGGA